MQFIPGCAFFFCFTDELVAVGDEFVTLFIEFINLVGDSFELFYGLLFHNIEFTRPIDKVLHAV